MPILLPCAKEFKLKSWIQFTVYFLKICDRAILNFWDKIIQLNRLLPSSQIWSANNTFVPKPTQIFFTLTFRNFCIASFRQFFSNKTIRCFGNIYFSEIRHERRNWPFVPYCLKVNHQAFQSRFSIFSTFFAISNAYNFRTPSFKLKKKTPLSVAKKKRFLLKHRFIHWKWIWNFYRHPYLKENVLCIMILSRTFKLLWESVFHIITKGVVCH